MSIKFHSTVILVNDLTVMKNFYMQVLQQEIEFDFGACIGLKCGLSLWKLQDDFHVTQKRGTAFHSSGNKNIEICFETDSFDLVVDELQKQNLHYLHTIIEEPWGQRTVRFFDPENNLIELGESMECFVKRFLNQGMSVEQVSARTSVPLQFVQSCVK